MSASGKPSICEGARLFVLEGPDDVGKTTLAHTLAEQLRATGTECDCWAFPGHEPGTLGKLVYDLHHDVSHTGLERLPPTSLQLLHVAAHSAAIESKILPALDAGRTVVLDRFWWSTWVYGVVAGVDRRVLRDLIALERKLWKTVQPAHVFLIERPAHTAENVRTRPKLAAEYIRLAKRETKRYPVRTIRNASSIDAAVAQMLRVVNASDLGGDTKDPPNDVPFIGGAQASVQEGLPERPFDLWSRLAPAKPTIVYETYWKFAVERQNIFFRRMTRKEGPWTEDPILKEYKFTNAYRAADRVSQYLIRHVQNDGECDRSSEDMCFRTLLFKTFNRIETWELLLDKLGTVSWSEYSYDRYDAILTRAIDAGQRIYSAAYIMPSGGRRSPYGRKHRMHLKLLERMMHDELPQRLADAPSMAKAFELLRSYPSIGDFLAYQYVTDLNYTVLTSFTEMDFVVPGPGALRGIHKCFSGLGGLTESELIKEVAKRQEDELSCRGLQFQRIGTRALQLVDCQNLFCEVDKYSRVKHPDIEGPDGRKRIKQRFRPKAKAIDYMFPPKWGVTCRDLTEGVK